MSGIEAFSADLIEQIHAAIATDHHHIVLWGWNSTTIKLLSELSKAGLSQVVTAVVDNKVKLSNNSISGFHVQPPTILDELDFDTLVITLDAQKEVALAEFQKYCQKLPLLIFAGNSNYEFDDQDFWAIVKSLLVRSKAGGYPNMLTHIYQSLTYIADRKLPGEIAEFGVYQGGTTVFMAKVLKHLSCDKRIYGFDTFEGFPSQKNLLDSYNNEKDEFPYYEAVKNYCAPYDIQLIQGDITDTYTRLAGIPLSFTFFDTDNYTATRKALELCYEQTVSGGIIAFDHYFSPTWEKTIGERIAAKQVLGTKQVFNLQGTGIFIKI